MFASVCVTSLTFVGANGVSRQDRLDTVLNDFRPSLRQGPGAWSREWRVIATPVRVRAPVPRLVRLCVCNDAQHIKEGFVP